MSEKAWPMPLMTRQEALDAADALEVYLSELPARFLWVLYPRRRRMELERRVTNVTMCAGLLRLAIKTIDERTAGGGS